MNRPLLLPLTCLWILGGCVQTHSQVRPHTESTESSGETGSATASEESSLETEMSKLLGDGDPRYKGTPISLDYREAPLSRIVWKIAEVADYQVVVDSDLDKRLSIRVKDVPWDLVLDAVLSATGMTQVIHGNMIRIIPIEQARKERDAVKPACTPPAFDREYTQIKFTRSSARGAFPILERIQRENCTCGDCGWMMVHEDGNQIFAQDYQHTLKKLKQLAKQLDVRREAR